MDFIVGLPRYHSNLDTIMIIVDRLTKIAHFIPTITIVTAYIVNELFIKELF